MVLLLELGFGLVEIQTDGEGGELKGDFLKSSHPAPVHQRVGTALLITFQGLVAGLHPEVPFGRAPFHGALDAGRGQRRAVLLEDYGIAFQSEGFGNRRLPRGHPTFPFFALAPFALEEDEIEESRRQFCAVALGAEGTAKGNQRGMQIVWRTPARAEPGPIRAAEEAAPGAADGMAVMTHGGAEA
jgi:hypothetical protein